MPAGRVEFYSAVLGFGFVVSDDGASEVAVQASAVEAAGLPGLRVGDEITYDLQNDRRFGRPVAVNVKIIKPAPGA